MNMGILLLVQMFLPRRYMRGMGRFAARLAGSCILAGLVQLAVLSLAKSYTAYLTVSVLFLVPGMVAGVFGADNLRLFLRRLLLGYAAAVVLGGIFGAAENLPGISRIPLWLSVPGIWLAREGMRFAGGARQEREVLRSVVLTHKGQKIGCTALLDSGNRLTEPIGERPVHIISGELFQLLHITAEDYVGLAGYQTLDRQDGLLALYEIDGIYPAGEEAKKTKAVVACAKERLLCQKPYQMILNVKGVCK